MCSLSKPKENVSTDSMFFLGGQNQQLWDANTRQTKINTWQWENPMSNCKKKCWEKILRFYKSIKRYDFAAYGSIEFQRAPAICRENGDSEAHRPQPTPKTMIVHRYVYVSKTKSIPPYPPIVHLFPLSNWN